MTDRLAAMSITAEDLIERHMQDNSAFRDEWERGAFGREVAHAVIRYRIAHDLDIEQLADRLGVAAETVGTVEDGENDPEVGILRLLSARLGFRFTLDIHPANPAGVEVVYSVA
ncbi:MAG: helix-turn-helix domain-containing protein [Chloroflexota bacterium]|nr:helix-turn-helix domain-containing protein [Chloroflexota bacterium]